MIIDLNKRGNGDKNICKWLNIPLSTVRAIIKKLKRYGTVENLMDRGCNCTLPPRIPRRMVREATKSMFCNGHLSYQTSCQSKTCGLSWRGQLIPTNPRMWRILKGYTKRNGPKSLQMYSLAMSKMTGRDSMLLSLPEVVALSTRCIMMKHWFFY